TLLVLCFVPFIVLFTVIFRKFSRRAFRKVKNATTDINTFLSENLSGIKVTQAFNQEETKKTQFERRNKALWKSMNREIIVFALFRPSVYMLYMFTIIAMWYVAGTSALGGIAFLGQTITYTTIVIFYQYIGQFFTPIQNLADQFNRMQSAFASSEKIFAIMDMEPTVVDEEGAEDVEIKGKIEFRHVWFRYVEDKWVLKDVSFVVEAGKTAAFVGSTGSGKTTIMALICRNYDIQSGQILIDDRDIKTIKIECLRKAIGQMLQDVFLFAGTIRSNIVLRDENITEQEAIDACKYVNADHFIDKLDHGLDEEVRERGNNFSAGQRQLLSFARTIVHKPTVMILDEATANIDTETELLIQNSLEKMMNIGTMLIVAHRLSTIQHCDNIIVLEKGEILEQGNHQELLAKKGRYYTLYELQYRKQQLM
ncbi:MAG: ABC transporter ATP-binding protein, partial [Clostridia bacterium]|nr:ABC transporter ATP-binding protein [Clostridia bacterium]